MWGPFFGAMGMASARLTLWLVGVGLWLMSRPGGWAVVVVAILVGVKLLPKEAAEVAAPLTSAP